MLDLFLYKVPLIKNDLRMFVRSFFEYLSAKFDSLHDNFIPFEDVNN
jgi:hypothetical protein